MTHEHFDTSVGLRLASPETIKSWSHGEIQKPETINYRTGRSERGGLFDERVFGPEKDYECYCGKYKRIRYNGVVCEKCGVEVTRSIVRRERMGHIELASPVAHIWFLRGIPSRMALLLGTPTQKLESVIYFAGYIIKSVDEEERAKVLKDIDGEFKSRVASLETEEEKDKLRKRLAEIKSEVTALQKFMVLNEAQYKVFSMKFSTVFEAGTGAEAVYDIFKNIDLAQLEAEVSVMLDKTDVAANRTKIEKRISLIRSLLRTNSRPEWMFVTVLPVIPPALRPMVALEGNRHATSDINDLYRRVINRNNRLKKLIEIPAPDVILRNEKRILQEAIDALFDNSIKKSNGTQAMSMGQRRSLKSLSDHLKGKQGIFRQNLLGKRVDYSGRSVIVIGPQLSLDQCGLPKYMALELFRPFVIAEVIKRGYAFNIRGASKFIEEGSAEVWEMLEKVIFGKYVLLNRAPTLHRLSIQAFKPILIEGKAIQVHPLVCSAFNADFDGDQMAVHIPLSKEAQAEARLLMCANKNILKPATGEPIATPAQDIVLGCYWLTKNIPGAKGEGKYFSAPNEAIMAYDYGAIDLRADIFVVGTHKAKYDEFEGKPFKTTVGKLLFNSIFPSNHKFINKEQKKKDLSRLVTELINDYGVDETALILDEMKKLGFKYMTISGTTFGFSDVPVSPKKHEIIARARKEIIKIHEEFGEGFISDHERYLKVIQTWEKAKAEVETTLSDILLVSESISDTVKSGARGNMENLNQSAGMKGVIQNASGQLLEFPITSSYIEGFTPFEYFINTTTARKGLADTALNTAKAGYLTRRLHDVAHDVIIREEECGTKKFILAKEDNIDGLIITLSQNIWGRVVSSDIKDESGKVYAKKNEMLTKKVADEIEKAGIKEVPVRSPLRCESLYGICQKCYGLDLGRNHLIKIGEAVGTIASQAIGEPGTQLTLRTFHSGGVAGRDITQGLPRVEEIFERRNVKAPAVVAPCDGEIMNITNEADSLTTIEVAPDAPKGGKKSGMITLKVDARRVILAKYKIGTRVDKGAVLTDGSADLLELMEYAGREFTENYILSEIRRVYELNSASVAAKHLELIIRQMFARRKIIDQGETRFTSGEVVELLDFNLENMRTEKLGGKIAEGKTVLMGISEVVHTTKSWLAAASFQHTPRMIISNAIRGESDLLRGLKENVIVGNLIPAGTGFTDDFIDMGLDEEPETVA